MQLEPVGDWVSAAALSEGMEGGKGLILGFPAGAGRGDLSWRSVMKMSAWNHGSAMKMPRWNHGTGALLAENKEETEVFQLPFYYVEVMEYSSHAIAK